MTKPRIELESPSITRFQGGKTATPATCVTAMVIANSALLVP